MKMNKKKRKKKNKKNTEKNKKKNKKRNKKINKKKNKKKNKNKAKNIWRKALWQRKRPQTQQNCRKMAFLVFHQTLNPQKAK